MPQGSRRRLDRASALPLWAQLLDDLRRRMARGEFDDAFPAELQLVEDYGVSRNTVREALRHLRTDGSVVAARGRRPRVAGAAEIEQPVGAMYSLFEAVEQAGMRPRSEVRALDIRRDAEVSRRLGLSRSTDLLYLERLRIAAGEPLAVDQVWYPASLASPLVDVDFTRTGFYDELADRTGIRLTGGRETIRARVPTDAERRLLAIGKNVAVFAIDRLGESRGKAVEWRHTVVRGDRFRVLTEFSAGTGYRLDVGAARDAGRRRPGGRSQVPRRIA
jgi:GntR family transcriptional regulator